MGITPRLHIKKMKASVMSSLVVLLALSSNSEARLQCDDCVQEMHKLGVLVKFYGEAISQYLQENYCPTLDSEDCLHDINNFYPKLLGVVIDHFIVDGAVHMCQMMMACPARATRLPCSKPRSSAVTSVLRDLS